MTVSTTDLFAKSWRMLIGGSLVSAADGAVAASLSPITQDVLAEVPSAGAEDVDRAVRAAADAFDSWRDLGTAGRVRLMRRVIDVLRDNEEELGHLDAIDGGNPITAMRGDVQLGIGFLEYMLEWVSGLRGSTLEGAPDHLHYTVHEPYGVVGRIIPYNHPLLFTTRALTPLVVGNTVVVKAPDQTPLSPLRLGELLADVLPPGVFNVLTGTGAVAGDALVRHPNVRRIAFTGSPATGRAIQRSAAEVGVKAITLELGGKNPMIAYPDADLEVAARGAVRGMNFHWSAGQSCGSTSRLLVHEDIADELCARVVAAVREIRIGDPLDPATEMGTMVTQAHADRVMGFIERAVDGGARVLAGGNQPRILDRPASFVSPTLLADVQPGDEIAQEEVFGPVLSILTWRDEDEVVRLANGVRYGLTASVFTSDIGRAHLVARQLDAGYIWVNTTSVHFPGVPFGGFKESGVGREEDPGELLSYLQPKAVNLALKPSAR